MRIKVKTILVIILVMLPSVLGARSLVNVSLGFGASYTPQAGIDYTTGMQDSDNWMFSGELSARFAFVQGQAMVFPLQCEDNGQGVLLIGMGSLNLPIIGSLFLEAGLGASTIYVPQNGSNARSYYVQAGGQKGYSDEIAFTDALLNSPVYLEAGLGSEFGPVGIRLRYLMQSSLDLQSFVDSPNWWGVFAIEKGTLSLALALKMF